MPCLLFPEIPVNIGGMAGSSDQHVGQLMKAIRVHRGLTPQALAEKAGVDIKTIRTLESGARRPQDTTERKIEDALQIPAGTIAISRDDNDYLWRFLKLLRDIEPSNEWLDPDETETNNPRFAKLVGDTMSQLGLAPGDVSQRGGPKYAAVQEILDNRPVGISEGDPRKA